MKSNRFQAKLDWPTNYREFRRHGIDHRFSPGDFENQLRSFEKWITSELRGLRPYIVQEEELMFHIPVSGTSTFKDSPRWFLEIEVDEFPAQIIEREEPSRWQRFVNFMTGAKPPKPEIVNYPREPRFYSLSPRQHNALKEWLNPALGKF